MVSAPLFVNYQIEILSTYLFVVAILYISFSLNRIFSENFIHGYERLFSANSMTSRIIDRLIDRSDSGIRAVGSVGSCNE